MAFEGLEVVVEPKENLVEFHLVDVAPPPMVFTSVMAYADLVSQYNRGAFLCEARHCKPKEFVSQYRCFILVLTCDELVIWDACAECVLFHIIVGKINSETCISRNVLGVATNSRHLHFFDM